MKVLFSTPIQLSDNLLSTIVKLEYAENETKNVCAITLRLKPQNLKVLTVFPGTTVGMFSSNILPTTGEVFISWTDTNPFPQPEIAVLILKGTPESITILKENSAISSPGNVQIPNTVFEDLVISLN